MQRSWLPPACLLQLHAGTPEVYSEVVNERKSLYGPASKTMVLVYMIGMVHGTEVDQGYSVHHCDRFMYWRMYVCDRFVLPTLTQRLLNKKNNRRKLLYKPTAKTIVHVWR